MLQETYNVSITQLSELNLANCPTLTFKIAKTFAQLTETQQDKADRNPVFHYLTANFSHILLQFSPLAQFQCFNLIAHKAYKIYTKRKDFVMTIYRSLKKSYLLWQIARNLEWPPCQPTDTGVTDLPFAMPDTNSVRPNADCEQTCPYTCTSSDSSLSRNLSSLLEATSTHFTFYFWWSGLQSNLQSCSYVTQHLLSISII